MIIINKDWALTNDQYSVTLFKCDPDKGTRKVAGHYPNFSIALKAMVDKNIQDLDSLKYMVEKLDGLKAHIDEICHLSPSPDDLNEK